MPKFMDVAKKIEKHSGLICVLGYFLTVYLISTYGYAREIENNFLTVSIALFAFVAIFYTVVVITRVINSIRAINNNDLTGLRNQIRALNARENNNNTSDEEKANICQEKVGIYEEMGRIRNRNLNTLLAKATGVYLFMLLFYFLAPPTLQILGVNKLSLSLIFFWIGICYILNIIIIFYYAHSR